MASVELKTYVEREAEKAESLSFCRGIKLLHIRNSVEELLSNIGRFDFFKEYTKHDISHVDEMLGIIEWLIPPETKKCMTSAEWLMLTLAVYFHDLGMVVTKKEYENRDKTLFEQYKNHVLSTTDETEYREFAEEEGDVFFYQEFVRENHANRIKKWIEGDVDYYKEGVSDEVKDIVKNILNNIDELFKRDLAMICASHHENDIDDFEKYKVNTVYGNNPNEKVNLNYIAIVLRVADLLHITRNRTPSITRKIINVSNPKSVIEWEKQEAVRAVKPQYKRNEEDNVDSELEKDTIEITAYFNGAETAEAYFGLSSYLQYTRKELQRCSDVIIKAQKKEGAVNYKFPWREIDESRITVIGFETKKLQFTIAQENILQLLVGHTLYNDSSVVVRELVQNAIDAIKLQNQYERKNNMCITKGEIFVEWDGDKYELSFWDNGTGMTIFDIENYLLKVGASKYRDGEIKREFPDFSPISHFGIGVLTCFMIADDVDIITKSNDDKYVNNLNLRKVNGSYLLSKVSVENVDDKIKKHGTMVKLHVRKGVDMSNLEKNLRKWVVLPEVPVYLKKDKAEKIRIGFSSLKEVIKKYLNDIGITVDGEKYDVYEETYSNVTVAYAVRHLKYLSDWCLMGVDNIRNYKKYQLPVGTCVEGIRVEFTTPGYKNTSILSIANIKNSKYQTNVARSALELNDNSEILSDIYKVYKNFVQKQIDALEQMNYSNGWALTEGRYLIKPLVANEYFNNRFNNHIEAIDENALIENMAEINSVVLENDNDRKVVSAKYVHDVSNVSIVVSKMTQAAETLLKEIKSDATLRNVIKVVCSEDAILKDVDNIFCNYDCNDVLHQYALSNKEVNSICVDYKQRLIYLNYSSKNDLWYEFKSMIHGVESKLYIPKKHFLIKGLRDEVGVKAYNSVFLQSDSKLCDYVLKIINDFLNDDQEEKTNLLEYFLVNVFNSKMLELTYSPEAITSSFLRNMMKDRFDIVNEELMEKIWNKIDFKEFTENILSQNYSLYAIENWSRNTATR